MKKVNLLSRAEMKKVMGGVAEEAIDAPCDDWATKSSEVCYNCCITVHSISYCGTKCGF